MVHYTVIPEIDVLEATVFFLRERHVEVYQVSVPKGMGIDKADAENRVWKVLCADGVPSVYPFSNEGQDVMGISATEWWQVECKGSGEGTPQTQRNNFDLALASVVSYYEEKPAKLPQKYLHYIGAKPYLGLALPASPAYMNEMKRRVRKPLRLALNLWILLYDPESKSIKAVSSEDNY
jgi:hypothetical protein